jgi:hypothetical protein
MRKLAAFAVTVVATWAAGCASLLDYDELSFENPDAATGSGAGQREAARERRAQPQAG